MSPRTLIVHDTFIHYYIFSSSAIFKRNERRRGLGLLLRCFYFLQDGEAIVVMVVAVAVVVVVAVIRWSLKCPLELLIRSSRIGHWLVCAR